MRNTGFIRQWKVLLAIDQNRTGIRLVDLAATIGVTDRTIRRDVDVLAALFPIEATTMGGKRRFVCRRKIFAETPR